MTSANVSGLPEANDAAGILEQLGESVELVLDGGTAHGGPPSTVVDCTADGVARVLRAGAVPVARVRTILADVGVTLAED